MKIAVIQPEYPRSYKKTLEVMEQFKSAAAECPSGTDLLVLPEYSNCPGMSDMDEMILHCEKYNDDFLKTLTDSAIENNIAIAVNMMVKKDIGFTNTTYVIDETGYIIADYDKTHLAFTEIDPMGLTAGKEPLFVDFKGVKITFAICFELYFPDFFEALAAQSPDIILCPSYQRSENSEILIKQAMGRALDSEAFVIRSSYSMGKESKNGGTSYAVSPSGEIILNMKQETGISVIEIDPHEKRMRPLAHGLGRMRSREIVEKFRIPSIYRKNSAVKKPLSEFNYPRVCAHRGLSGFVPENTLPAFTAALAVGADEIEFDVRLTKDNKMIVCHDGTVDRVSNGTGNILDLTFDEMRKLNAGEYMGWKDIKFPTTEEVFELLGGQIIMNIHVYESGENGSVIQRLKDLIYKYDVASHVYFAASEKEMAWCLKLAPEIDRCMLECFDENRDIVDIALKYKCSRVQHFCRVYSSEIVKKATVNGLISNLFYEDNPDRIKSWLDDGIDTVLTNYADRIIPLTD